MLKKILERFKAKKIAKEISKIQLVIFENIFNEKYDLLSDDIAETFINIVKQKINKDDLLLCIAISVITKKFEKLNANDVLTIYGYYDEIKQNQNEHRNTINLSDELNGLYKKLSDIYLEKEKLIINQEKLQIKFNLTVIDAHIKKGKSFYLKNKESTEAIIYNLEKDSKIPVSKKDKRELMSLSRELDNLKQKIEDNDETISGIQAQ